MDIIQEDRGCAATGAAIAPHPPSHSYPAYAPKRVRSWQLRHRCRRHSASMTFPTRCLPSSCRRHRPEGGRASILHRRGNVLVAQWGSPEIGPPIWAWFLLASAPPPTWSSRSPEKQLAACDGQHRKMKPAKSVNCIRRHRRPTPYEKRRLPAGRTKFMHIHTKRAG